MKKVIIFFAIVLCCASCNQSTNVEKIPSFIITKYLGEGITATAEVFGNYNEYVDITFTNLSGEFGSVSLNPGNPSASNRTLYSGAQIMTVYSINFTEPSQFVPGQIHINCDFSNSSGMGTYFFVGLLAAWTLD